MSYHTKTMKHLFIIITLLTMAYSVEAQNRADISSLCAKIDDAIANSQQYVAQREANIAMERRNLKMAHDTQQKFNNSFRLYELYRPFVSDSAIYFLKECVNYARQLGDPSEVLRCQSLYALRCSNIGMYDEALMTLDSINLTGVSREAMGEYFRARNNVYNELGYYSRLDNMRDAYYQQAGKYEALMYETLPPDDPDCYARRELALNAKGDLKAALQLNDEWLKTVEPGSHPYALVTLYRYLEFKAQNDSAINININSLGSPTLESSYEMFLGLGVAAEFSQSQNKAITLASIIHGREVRVQKEICLVKKNFSTLRFFLQLTDPVLRDPADREQLLDRLRQPVQRLRQLLVFLHRLQSFSPHFLLQCFLLCCFLYCCLLLSSPFSAPLPEQSPPSPDRTSSVPFRRSDCGSSCLTFPLPLLSEASPDSTRKPFPVGRRRKIAARLSFFASDTHQAEFHES